MNRELHMLPEVQSITLIAYSTQFVSDNYLYRLIDMRLGKGSFTTLWEDMTTGALTTITESQKLVISKLLRKYKSVTKTLPG